MSVVEECYRGSQVRVFRLNREAALASLRRRAQALLVERAEVREVRLFGSLKDDRAGPGSDADILIILANSSVSFPERIPVYAAYFSGIGLPCDVFPYTTRELASNHFAAEAASHSAVLATRSPGPPCGA